LDAGKRNLPTAAIRLSVVITLLLHEELMLITIRRLGNSQGILIPKPLLQQVGLSDRAEMIVEGNTLVLRRPKPGPRHDWAEWAKDLEAGGDDAPVWPDFANEEDSELRW
jgi:antitoxin MazE